MNRRGTLGRIVQNQVETLVFGARREHLDTSSTHQAQVEARRFDRQLAGFDLREIEDVVDHGSSASPELRTVLAIFALLGGEIGIEQQAGHADDAVHGRANFVAHVGEELALRLARRFGLTLRGS